MKHRDLRQLCVRIYPVYINMFSLAGRYKLYEIIFNTCHHAGVVGFTIGLYKQQVDLVLKQPHPDRHYVGRNLRHILKLVSKIPDGATTDLLDNSDRIFALLNFIRYLILRDTPNTNATGIWDHYPSIEKEFFDPLRHAIELSKGHYKMDLEDLKNGKPLETEGMDFSVSVGGSDIGSVSAEQRIQIVESSINTFDMMDSILSRIIELVDVQKRSVKTEVAS